MAGSDDQPAPSADTAEGKLADAASGEASELLSAVIHSRQTVLPRRLAEPAPDAQQLATILASAAAAPDHGQLTPWRFVIVPADVRCRLADAFGSALLERDPQASIEQVEQAAFLLEQECDLGQGYWFGRPVPALEIDWARAPLIA